MRQAKMTGKPARGRRGVGAFGALLMGLAALPAQAQVTPPDAATKAAMEKRAAARTLLSSALARIAANNSDSRALLDAGRASIELDDYRAALGFLVRAEQSAPRDGTVKAALGSAMVHMENPTRALDYFGEAQLLGAPERLFLSDRGLARDLLGQQDAAQRDYQIALAISPNDELTRRYSLSLGISGETDRAVAMLTPQLRAQDRGAWRLRDDSGDERPRRRGERDRQRDDAARDGAEYPALSDPDGSTQPCATGRRGAFRAFPERPAGGEAQAGASGGRGAVARRIGKPPVGQRQAAARGVGCGDAKPDAGHAATGGRWRRTAFGDGTGRAGVGAAAIGDIGDRPCHGCRVEYAKADAG